MGAELALSVLSLLLLLLLPRTAVVQESLSFASLLFAAIVAVDVPIEVEVEDEVEAVSEIIGNLEPGPWVGLCFGLRLELFETSLATGSRSL